MRLPPELENRITLSTTKNITSVEEIHYPTVECEDCGKHVVDRRVHHKLIKTPVDHWRVYCKYCGFYRDPETGEFTMSSQQMYQYSRRLRGTE